jgi:hypothetical protein
VVPADNHLTATYDIGKVLLKTPRRPTGIISDPLGVGYVLPATL